MSRSLLARAAFGLVAPLVLVGAVAAQTTHVVDQFGLSFSPQDLTIDVGDTVEWRWTVGDHTVTEGTGPFPTGSEAFNSLLSSSTPVFSVTFDAAFLAANPRPGNLYDYYCVPHLSFAMVGTVTVNEASPWTDLGGGLAGIAGIPQLSGTGTLVGGTNATVELVGAAPSALSNLFLSAANTPVPFKCGTLSTVPVLLSLPLVTSPTGAILIPFAPWPAGLPAGVDLYWQYAIQDGAAVCGVSISNLLQATLP